MLNTGRLLEHWHTGSMTRRSFALDAIAPERAWSTSTPTTPTGSASGRRRLRPGHARGAATIELHGVGLAPRDAGHVLHPVPLPRGGGQPADDRRDRPVRQDPRVQVLRRPDRALGRRGATSASAREPFRHGTAGVRRASPPCPASRRGRGKFPGPSLIPALIAIQDAATAGCRARSSWRSPRELRRPLYEIEGLISFYPHFRTDAAGDGRAARLPRPYLLAAGCERADRRDAGERTAMTWRSSSSRSPASVAATPRRRLGQRAPGARRPRSTTLVAAARGGDDREPAALARGRRAVAQRPVRRRRGALPGRPRALLAGELAAGADRRDAEGRRPARHGRRRLPDRARSGSWSSRSEAGDAKYADLQRRRVRAGHVQGPPDPRRAAAPGARGPAARDARDRRRGGLGLHPARVRPRGGGAARRARALRAAGPARRRRARHRPALRSRSSPRPAATSSARRRRCSSAWRAIAASRATSRRSPACYGLWGRPTLMNSVETFADVPDHPRARRRTGGSDQGVNDCDGPEVLRRVRSRRAARRLLRADRARTIRELHRARRRSRRRPRARRGTAGRRVVELPRARAARRAARLRRARRGRLDAGLRRAGGAGRGHRPARRGDERAALLPQRVVRQVRPVPGRLARRPTRSSPRCRGRRRRRATSTGADPRARGDAAA